jgi:hypothetical protein
MLETLIVILKYNKSLKKKTIYESRSWKQGNKNKNCRRTDIFII